MVSWLFESPCKNQSKEGSAFILTIQKREREQPVSKSLEGTPKTPRSLTGFSLRKQVARLAYVEEKNCKNTYLKEMIHFQNDFEGTDIKPLRGES